MQQEPVINRIVADRYQLIRLLGSGGMGSVYLARDIQSGELRAVKEIAAHLLRIPGARDRFRNEIQATFKIVHPRIVRAYDFIDQPNYQALVLEYIEGETLHNRMQRGRFSVEETISVLIQLLQGLEAVHAVGIVHRDLKPDNLFLSNTGELKITDFGVAALGGDSTLTQAGKLVGTAKYFSPEYIETGECDARGDLYAVAVLAYELVTGVSPFKAQRLQDLMMERFKMTVAEDLALLAPHSPLALRNVIAKAMKVPLVERFQSAGEAIEALSAIAPVATKPKKSPSAQAEAAPKKRLSTLIKINLTVLLLIAILWVVAIKIL